MNRGLISDAAVSAAKAYCHAAVERRHVLFALARHFRERPECAGFPEPAKRALEPRGNAYGTPSVSEAARALLDTLKSDDDAIAALRQAFQDGGASSGAGAAGGQAAETAETSAPRAQPQAAATRSAESVADVLAELDALTGLGAVKAQVRRIVAVVQANAEREKAGLRPVKPGLHLVFTGPPGTGKTTVARLVARLYAAAGALPGSNFSEATRADLIAGYVGQTAIKTHELINRTRPGVLFVDEAYSLTPTSGVDYGHEAIATLVKAMEDHRDDFAVIVAGYGDEMQEFIESNPGLRSRFKTYIDFPDYSAPELGEIFGRMAHEVGIALGPGVLEKAADVFAAASGKRAFGNARFARSLFEQAYAHMATRAAGDGAVTVEELTTLQAEDIDTDLSMLPSDPRRIGF